MVSNWQLIKIGFFVAFGWWIAATLSDSLDFGIAVLGIIVRGAVGQPA